MLNPGESSLGHQTRPPGERWPQSHSGIPPSAGTSFKPLHADGIADEPGDAAWFEVHPENYMVAGGPRLRQLEALRADFPLSLHGVGLSLGAGERPDAEHLGKLRTIVERFEPGLVSEHVAWSSYDGLYMADLLPTAFTQATLTGLVDAIDATQEALGLRILIENPASYLPRPESWISEVEFIVEAAQRSGCGLLVDVNNIHVSAHNLDFDPRAYVDALPAQAIREIHVADHDTDHNDGDPVLIDTHGGPVAETVWALYRRLVRRIGRRPTLVEWDTDIPGWPVLRAQAALANDHALRASDVGAMTS